VNAPPQRRLFQGASEVPPGAANESVLPLRATPPIAALLAFERTASLKSFSRAALELAVTQSAVSHQIRRLEGYFGTQLFIRGGKAISLTEQGEAFAREVRAGLIQLDCASRNLLRRGRSNRDRLRVRICSDLAHLFFFDAFEEFEQTHPNLSVSLDVGAGGRSLEGDGPLIILQVGKTGLANMHLQPLLDIAAVPVAAHGLAVADIDDPMELTGQRLIHMRAYPTCWRDWLPPGAGDVLGNAAIWVDGVAAALQAARAGLGVALAPWPLVTHVRGGSALRIGAVPDGGPRQTLYMACRPELRDDRHVAAFGNWLTRHLAEAGIEASSPFQ
jgi:LysR family glycine cleavage system transcriptional activator